MNAETIGQRIVRLRKAHDLTQEELAEIVGTSGTYIGHIESGRRAPGMDLCVKLADAFGISLDELIRGTAPKSTLSTDDAPPVALEVLAS